MSKSLMRLFLRLYISPLTIPRLLHSLALKRPKCELYVSSCFFYASYRGGVCQVKGRVCVNCVTKKILILEALVTDGILNGLEK